MIQRRALLNMAVFTSVSGKEEEAEKALSLTAVDVQLIRLDAALNHRRRQVDAIGREILDQGLRDDAAAHVAGGCRRAHEVFRVPEIDLDVEAGHR